MTTVIIAPVATCAYIINSVQLVFNELVVLHATNTFSLVFIKYANVLYAGHTFKLSYHSLQYEARQMDRHVDRPSAKNKQSIVATAVYNDYCIVLLCF